MKEHDDAMAALYAEELTKALEKITRNSGTYERYEAVMEEMKNRYHFLMDERVEMDSVEPEEMDMLSKLLEYDRLQK